jgi:hypothetical protein
MPISEHDRDFIQTMYKDDCEVREVQLVFPLAGYSTLTRMRRMGLSACSRKLRNAEVETL